MQNTQKEKKIKEEKIKEKKMNIKLPPKQHLLYVSS